MLWRLRRQAGKDSASKSPRIVDPDRLGARTGSTPSIPGAIGPFGRTNIEPEGMGKQIMLSYFACLKGPLSPITPPLQGPAAGTQRLRRQAPVPSDPAGAGAITYLAMIIFRATDAPPALSVQKYCPLARSYALALNSSR